MVTYFWLDGRMRVQLHFAEIVAGGQQFRIMTAIAIVDVGSVCGFGPNADGSECYRAGVGRPFHVPHRTALRYLSARGSIPFGK